MENKNWIYAEGLADSACVRFCKTFDITKPVQRAEVTATALGIYNLYINGKKVGDALFKPGWTSYNYRLQYQKYDLTDYLHGGTNEISFLCAPGWAVGYLGKGNINHTYADHISLTAIINIIYNDESTMELTTDPSWDIVKDQVIASEFYHGETQDLSAAPTSIGKAKADAAPDTRLIPDEGADVTEHERLKPVKLIITPKGERVIDFGQNLAGYVEIRVKGNRGDRITISHAEVLDRDGNFYTKNLELARCTNTYILSGNEDILKPNFTFQGYRYIRLDEYPFDEVDLSRFTSVAVYSDMERTGSFSCGNEKVNRLYSNSIWGQRSNFIDVPTDCPQRDERCGWTGDVLAFAKTAAIHYDVSAVLRKWLHDLILEQKSDGAIYGVVPSVNERGLRVSTAWGDVITVAPWEMYLAYGDVELLEECYPAMLRWISYIRHSGDEEYLWLGGNHYGDWLASDAILSPEHREGATQTDLIASAYFAHSVELAIKAGRVLKKDTKDLELLHQNIRKKFREYFIKDGLPTIYPKYDALSVNREEALKELGEAAYEKFGAEQFPELAQRIGEIDSETERITVSVEKAKREDEERRAAEEARRAEEEAKRAARTCGHCGTVNPEGTNFCMACGRRISAPEPAAKGTVCPNCGNVCAAGMKFCQECGTRLSTPQKLICPGCGAEHRQGMRFCGECGQKLN